MQYKDLNDYELISYVMNNEEVVDILFEKYRPLIYSIAKKLYNENDNMGLELTDLIQEGMIGFSIALNTYNEHKDTLFFTYAKKCIESKIYTMIKTAKRLKHQILNSSLSMDAMNEEKFKNSLDKIIGDNTHNPENIAIDNENVLELIKGVRKEFTELEKGVFDLKKSGFNYKEIAEALDMSPKSVDNAIQRIKAKIKKYLENR